MSLLLDALKKAEKEKQKAREAEAAATEVTQAQESESDISVDEELIESNEIVDEVEQQSQSEIEQTDDDELELILDEHNIEQEEIETTPAEDDELLVDEPPLAPAIELEKNTATTSTVSDEALQLLVYKTNKRYRQQQKIIWGSLVSVTIFILLIAAAYNYYGMLEEVDALENKHKLAMRSVRAEPVKRHLKVESQKPEITQVDTSRNAIQEQVGSKKTSVVKKAAAAFASSSEARKVDSRLSIERTIKVDPISVLLHEAWAEYNQGDYSSAKNLYEKVLNQEPKNRDALLGAAAVDVKLGNYKKAKASYQLLLKLNPRDQVAVAAMVNIENISSGTLGESKLKFMLQQQPSASHLSFALGNLYAKKRKWPEAQSAYFEAWKNNSDNVDYVYNLAVSLDQLGKQNEALQFYKQSLTLAGNKRTSFSKQEVEKRIQRISIK